MLHAFNFAEAPNLNVSSHGCGVIRRELSGVVLGKLDLVAKKIVGVRPAKTLSHVLSDLLCQELRVQNIGERIHGLGARAYTNVPAAKRIGAQGLRI